MRIDGKELELRGENERGLQHWVNGIRELVRWTASWCSAGEKGYSCYAAPAARGFTAKAGATRRTGGDIGREEGGLLTTKQKIHVKSILE